jgi:toxin ParE1/3/4
VSSGRYILLPQANEDLVESSAYLIESASIDVATRFVRSIFSTSALIATMPGIGLNCRLKRPELRKVRRLPVTHFARWLIFYSPSSEGIEVLRVIHSSRNWRRLFE